MRAQDFEEFPGEAPPRSDDEAHSSAPATPLTAVVAGGRSANAWVVGRIGGLDELGDSLSAGRPSGRRLAIQFRLSGEVEAVVCVEAHTPPLTARATEPFRIY